MGRMDMVNSHTALVSLALAVAAGTMLMAFSRRLGLPSIVLLLAGGIVLGPEMLGAVRADALGPGLGALISFAVGIILFEAGLTLDPRDYRRAPHVIIRLLTVGVMTTWLGTALAVWYFAGRTANGALLAASLVIVTGPTVVGPLLKRIKVKPRVHSILYWEGVLIDPVGVFVAVLCFELIGNEAGLAALGTFGMRVLFGLVVGLAGGFVMSELLRRRAVPEDMAGAFALGCGALTFAAAEAVASESGLACRDCCRLCAGHPRSPADPPDSPFQGGDSRCAGGVALHPAGVAAETGAVPRLWLAGFCRGGGGDGGGAAAEHPGVHPRLRPRLAREGISLVAGAARHRCRLHGVAVSPEP